MPGPHRLNFIDIVGGFWKPSQLAGLWKSSGDTIVALGSGNPRSRLVSDATLLMQDRLQLPVEACTSWTLDLLWFVLRLGGCFSVPAYLLPAPRATSQSSGFISSEILHSSVFTSTYRPFA